MNPKFEYQNPNPEGVKHEELGVNPLELAPYASEEFRISPPYRRQVLRISAYIYITIP